MDPFGLGPMSSDYSYWQALYSGFFEGLSQGLDNFNNTVTFGLYDSWGWSGSWENTGWEHDLSRGFAAIPRDVLLFEGAGAAYQALARPVSSAFTSVTSWFGSAATTGPVTTRILTANLSEALVVTENGIAVVTIEYAAAPLSQLTKSATSAASTAGARTVVVNTGIIDDAALASSLSLRAASGELFLGGQVQSIGTASAPKFTITIPLK
jgi:hypothetical protein